LAGHEGNFNADGTGQEFHYEVESWKDAQGNQHTDIEDSDLPNVDFMILKVTNIDTGQSDYETISGPMVDWEYVEDILEYDWGEEGSR
jgi:hypothetical protein